MGCFPNKKKGLHEKDLRGLVEKIRVLELEIDGTMCDREKESRAFKKEIMVFACKEAEWKEERKRLKAEMKMLRKMLKEKEWILLEMETGGTMNGAMMGNYRDETLEKWKQLCFAIKFELDHLVQRTNGETLYWRSKKVKIMKELNRELKDKEDTFQTLKAQLVIMGREQHRSKTEVDILRQSLRIVRNQMNLQ